MRAFKDLPIKQKLSTLIMLTCVLVLLLACGAFVGYEYFLSRRALKETVQTLTAIAGENSTAAIAFGDKSDAQRTLKVLQADPRIIGAALYDAKGQLFAAFGEGVMPDSPPPLRFKFIDGELLYAQTVEEGGQPLGTVFVRASTAQIYVALRTYLSITLTILLVSFVVAWVVATAVRRRIARPILELAETTQKVSHETNYAARATKHGNDELGQLTDSFNRMMARIQKSDTDLRRSQERLRLALEAGRIGTWDWDVLENHVYWDPYVYPLFGVQPGELQATLEGLLERVHVEDRDTVRSTVGALLTGTVDVSFSFRVLWPDGTIRHLTARGGFSPGESGVKRVTGVLIDITQAKRAEEEVRRLNEELEQRVVKRTEELAHANKELEAFTYSVSHDLRAPLRHINGFAQMLEQDYSPAIPAEAQRLLARIRVGARNMGQLVDDLLRLARVGRQELIHQPWPLSDMVEQVIRDLRTETEPRQIEWKVGDLPTVACDAGLIRQVFTNLVANAVKYSRNRPRAVIEIGSRIQGGDWLIYVRDNGVGFDMKYVEKLFGVFQRLHRVEDFEGTGVGLAIVQRIIHKHGGRVWAEGSPDQGACFSFTLPIESPTKT